MATPEDLNPKHEDGGLPEPIDGHLRIWVHMANKGLPGMGITLTVGGAIVTGTLIGVRQYFDLFAANYAAGLKLEPEHNFHKLLRAPLENLDRQDEKYPDKLPNYIHLQDAKYYMSNGFVPADGLLWRGKLDTVDGWSLGQWQPGKA